MARKIGQKIIQGKSLAISATERLVKICIYALPGTIINFSSSSYEKSSEMNYNIGKAIIGPRGFYETDFSDLDYSVRTAFVEGRSPDLVICDYVYEGEDKSNE